MKTREIPFWALSSIFGETRIFLENPALVVFVSRFLLPRKISENNAQILRKTGHKRIDRLSYGQT